VAGTCNEGTGQVRTGGPMQGSLKKEATKSSLKILNASVLDENGRRNNEKAARYGQRGTSGNTVSKKTRMN